MRQAVAAAASGGNDAAAGSCTTSAADNAAMLHAIGVTLPFAGSADDSVARAFSTGGPMIRVAVRFAAARNDAARRRTAVLPIRSGHMTPLRRRRTGIYQLLIGAFHAAHYRAKLVAEFLRDLSPAHVLAAQGENPL